ncbi:hypothetical protein HY605_02650 [Candidatus Peregrinibacteria bacterium]|nr:hypothetical protein [Candidatus Peregrinibacteria bacterium]
MDYSEIKKHFLASLTAVVVGVALLGVNSAFGALAEPAEEPANATLHSPVFNGVDVKGSIVNSGAANDGAVVVNDDLGIQNNLVVGKDALVINLQTAGNLTVGSGVGGGNLIVRNEISNDSGDEKINDPVKINDGLKVVKNVSFDRDLDMNGGKIYSRSGDFVNIGDHTIVDGRFETINGYGIASAGDVLASRDLSAERDALIERNIDVHGYISNENAVDNGGGYEEFVPLEIRDTQGLLVTGNRITVDGNNGYLMIDSNAISNPEGDLILQQAAGVDVKVGTNIFQSDLIVAGKITGSAIGTFDKKSSGILPAAGVVGTPKIFSTVACDPGEIVLDCSIKSYTDAGGAIADSDAFNITKLDADLSTRRCNIAVTKNLAADRWVEGFATCFNPAS